MFAIEARPLGLSASVLVLTVYSFKSEETMVVDPAALSVTCCSSSFAAKVNELPVSVPCLAYFTNRVSLSSVVSAEVDMTLPTTPVLLPI